jgi:hypothetical protein
VFIAPWPGTLMAASWPIAMAADKAVSGCQRSRVVHADGGIFDTSFMPSFVC